MRIKAKIPPRYAEVTLELMEIGEAADDGSIYIGYHNKKDWYAAVDVARDMDGSLLRLDFNQAAEYARNLTVHGRNDWQVPPGDRDPQEPNILEIMNLHVKNNTSDPGVMAFWSSTKMDDPEFAFARRFDQDFWVGLQLSTCANLRCVRAVARKPGQ